MFLSIDIAAPPQIIIARGRLDQRLLASLRAGGDGGSAAVEIAVCLPVLLLVVTGILTFGLALSNYMTLTNATSIGARALAISRGQSTDPCLTTANAVYAAAPTLTKATLSFTFVFNGTSYPGATCSNASALVQGLPAQVTVTYPCSLAVYGTNYAPTCLLTAKTTELVQ